MRGGTGLEGCAGMPTATRQPPFNTNTLLAAPVSQSLRDGGAHSCHNDTAALGADSEGGDGSAVGDH